MTTRKQNYEQAYNAGVAAWIYAAENPAKSIGESNAWYEWRDDFLLVLNLSHTELERRYQAFVDGYRDMNDREPD